MALVAGLFLLILILWGLYEFWESKKRQTVARLALENRVVHMVPVNNVSVPDDIDIKTPPSMIHPRMISHQATIAQMMDQVTDSQETGAQDIERDPFTYGDENDSVICPPGGMVKIKIVSSDQRVTVHDDPFSVAPDQDTFGERVTPDQREGVCESSRPLPLFPFPLHESDSVRPIATAPPIS